MAQKLKPGDKAPDFSLKDQDGNTVTLAQFLGKKNLVLYFYQKDFTMGCTAEACAFRDSYEIFLEKGAEVIGVSADPAESHREFREQHRLPFTLLSDPGWKTAEMYGAGKVFGLIPSRVSFIIDKKGVIRHVFVAQFRAELHTAEALRVLDELGV